MDFGDLVRFLNKKPLTEGMAEALSLDEQIDALERRLAAAISPKRRIIPYTGAITNNAGNLDKTFSVLDIEGSGVLKCFGTDVGFGVYTASLYSPYVTITRDGYDLIASQRVRVYQRLGGRQSAAPYGGVAYLAYFPYGNNAGNVFGLEARGRTKGYANANLTSSTDPQYLGWSNGVYPTGVYPSEYNGTQGEIKLGSEEMNIPFRESLKIVLKFPTEGDVGYPTNYQASGVINWGCCVDLDV